MNVITESTRPFTAASFNQYITEGKLMASHCDDCGTLFLPPRAICPECYSQNLAWVETKGKGKLAGFTVVYIAPTFMVEQGFSRENPYVSGVVELEESVNISARILGVDPTKPEAIQVGTRLVLEMIESGEGETRKVTLGFRAL